MTLLATVLPANPPRIGKVRMAILTFAILAYVLALGTSVYLIGFVAGVPVLPKTIDSGIAGARGIAIGVDLALLALFAVQHSVMARQGFKRWWTRIVPEPAERSSYVLAATLALLLLIVAWRPMPAPVWSVTDPTLRTALYAIEALGWAVALAATFLIDHLEMFGLRQASNQGRGASFTAPAFRTPGLYRMVRHPLYLGFVLAFWATPTMSEGRLLFAIAATAYILVGIGFEERDLVARFGETYRSYRRRVPMLVPLPLRVRRSDARGSAGDGRLP
jgi:protein-S-isoprenylcysteine O-methyltransferase Ste14